MNKHSLIFTNQFKEALNTLASNSLSTEKGKKAGQFIKASVQFFFEGVGKLGAEKKVADIQAFTASEDIPDVQYAFDTFSRVGNWDNRYENAFKVRSFNDNQGSFSIVTIADGGFTFDQLPEGGTVTVRRFSGSEVIVKAVTYAEAVGWYWSMIEDRQFSEMIDQLQIFTASYYSSKSKNHYRLLTDAAFDTANGNPSVPWQGTTSDSVLTRDRLTLSKMADDIADACKSRGYGDVATSQYDVYCRPLLAQRLLDAVNGMMGASNGVGGVPPYNIRINPTFNLSRTTGTVLATDAIMCLSGNQIQRGDKLAPTSYQTTDNLSFSEIVTVRARYGAAVADVKQTIKGAFA